MPNSARVYVGNLPNHVRDREVERFFKGFGRIREVVIKPGYGFVEFDDPRDADDAVAEMDGKDFQGGRVRVQKARDPRDRRRDYGRNNYNDRRNNDYGGRRGGYDNRGGYDRRDNYRDSRDNNRDRDRGSSGRQHAPGPKTKYRIIVTNLSSRTSWQDLKDYFRAAGEITYTNAHQPRQGEGIVEFADSKGLDYALDHQGELELDGRRLKVMEERGRRSRSDSRSRSPHSRSRSRSYSRSRSGSRSASRSRSRSRNDDRGRSRSRSGSRSRSRSRSGSRNGDVDRDR